MDTLIDVLVDDDGNDIALVAKIVGESNTSYHVKFLCERSNGLYKYDKEPTEIEKECVSGFYDSKDERDAGFVQVENNYFQLIEEYDEDYDPSTDDESDDESLVSEEENLDE